jgi:phosphoglycolate phosphatase
MHLLFDFDGTLVNSFDYVIAKALILAKNYGIKPINQDEIQKLRDMSTRQIIQYLNIPTYRLPTLVTQMRSQIRQDILRLHPVEGIHEMLNELYQTTNTMGIVTSNSVDNVAQWLKMYGMIDYFSFIHAEHNFFSKRKLIKKTMRQHEMDPKKTVYIGDETRDIDAAKKSGIRSIGVTWGYNSEKALRNHEPTYIAKSPNEICRYFAAVE